MCKSKKSKKEKTLDWPLKIPRFPTTVQDDHYPQYYSNRSIDGRRSEKPHQTQNNCLRVESIISKLNCEITFCGEKRMEKMVPSNQT